MKTEVSTAASFVTTFLRTAGRLTAEQLHNFSQSLEKTLLEYYQHHWFPQAPNRGSGYRCLRINHKMDPLIGKAACATGLTRDQLLASLPCELTLWVDPYEVSYRIGEDGSICVLYESSPPLPRTASSADKGPTYKGALKTGLSRKDEDGSACVLYQSSHPLPRTASSAYKGPSCMGALKTGWSRIGGYGSTCVLYQSSHPLLRTASSAYKGPFCMGALRSGWSCSFRQINMMTFWGWSAGFCL